MLSPYRVLDLTDEHGLFCGQLLADLGADVIAVEPPGGSPARRIGRFADDIADPDRSLFWWSYSRNKRSVVVDLEAGGGGGGCASWCATPTSCWSRSRRATSMDWGSATRRCGCSIRGW